MRTLMYPLVLLAAGQALAEVQWLPPADHELTPTVLIGADRATAAPGLNDSRASARYAWLLDFGDQPDALDARTGYQAESRQYWLDDSAAGLARGIELPLSAPGALIRISLLGDGVYRLDPDQLQLRLNGHALRSDDLSVLVDGSALRNAHMEVPENTLGFGLAPAAGDGTLNLALRTTAPPQTPVIIHVFEPDSDITAHLSLPRMHYLAGEQILLDVTLEQAGQRVQPDQVVAVLTSPDLGTSLVLDGDRSSGEWTARLPDHPSLTPGLPWEARVYIDTRINGVRVLRDVQAAFSIALPIARLSGEVGSANASQPAAEVGVEAVQAGRFQLSGVLYGTTPAGQLRPVAMAHSAAWLEPGRHTLSLDFTELELAESGLSAPWEIRDLRLTDQGRMGLLQRAEGLRLAH